MNIKIEDRYSENILQYFEVAHKFINNALYDIDASVINRNPFDTDNKEIKPIKDRVIFIHCQGGVSRSSSIVISYLMKTKQMKLRDAIDYVANRRHVICPNSGFLKQLQQYETFLFGNDDNQYHTEQYIEPKKECMIL